MELRPAVIELVVADMGTTLAFYRRLGLDIGADADGEPHVDVDLGGMRLAFDTEDTIRSFDPSWSRPSDAFWGMRYAVVHDPDGTPVDLFSPLPG